MQNLDFSEFAALAQDHDIIPIFQSFSADLDTPVSAFLKIKEGDYSFLFESVVGGEKWARYSFLGVNPERVFIFQNNELTVIDSQAKAQKLEFSGSPLDELKKYVLPFRVYQDKKLPRFFGGLVGYFSYNMIRYFESVKLSNPRTPDIPDFVFLMADTVVIFDNFEQVMMVVSCAKISQQSRDNSSELKKIYQDALAKISATKQRLETPIPYSISAAASSKELSYKMSLNQKEFCQTVEKCKQYIENGDVFQVVPSVRFEIERQEREAFAVYRSLRKINPSPYMYYLQMKDFEIVGASPEVLVRVADQKVQVRPIAGTKKRGETDEQDKKLERELLSDPKELAEHIMLVDLGRNDIGRIAEIGSVRVDDFEVVERYSHVMHLVSHVSGTLHSDKNVFDVIAATFPAGTLSGAPKIRAMQIIEEVEPVARGVYAGAVGYIGFSQNMDFAIAIRTALFHQDKIFVQAGAGIVHNSVPELEFQECQQKAGALLEAIKRS